MTSEASGRPEGMSDGQFREQIKSEFARFADDVSEMALSGQLIGIAGNLLLANGGTTTFYLGVRPTEAIGMLELTVESLKRRLLA